MNTLLLRFVVSASLARLVNEGLALAVVLVVLDRTGSTAEAGWLVAASTFPQLLTGPVLGPVLDRAGHPWAIVRGAAVLTAAAAVLLAATAGRAALPVPLLGALAMAVAEPLLHGGISALGGRGGWSASVFAWDSLAYNAAGLAGPAVVTVVATTASPAWALAAVGLACGLAAVTSLGLRAGGPAPPTEHAPRRSTLAAAVGLVASRPALRSATLATTLAFAALGGLSFALVAATAAVGRPPSDAGIAVTVSAVGGLVGSLAMTRRGAPAHPERVVLVSVAALAAPLVVMGVGSWPALLAGAFALGLLDGPLLVGLFATRSDHTPVDLRATVFTVGASAKLGAGALGAVVAGQVLDGRVTGAGLTAIGLAHLVAALAGWLSLRGRPRRRARAPGTCPSRRPQAAPR